MILNISVQVNADQFTINVPQIGFSEDLPNIIGLDENNKICVIGETEDDLRYSEDFKAWLKKHEVRFINPFMFDKHGVTYAAAILDFYAHRILQKMGNAWLIRQLLYRCDYNVFLWNNNSLSPEDRYEFEYTLRKKHSLKIRNILINGNPIESPSTEFLEKKKRLRRQRQVADWTLRIFSFIWFVVLFVPLVIMSAFVTLVTLSVFFNEPIDANNWMLISIVVLAISVFGFLSFVLSMLLALASWMYILRHYIPNTIMRDFLPSIGISKILVDRLADSLLGEANPNHNQII